MPHLLPLAAALRFNRITAILLGLLLASVGSVLAQPTLRVVGSNSTVQTQPTLRVGTGTQLVGSGAVRLVYGGGTITNDGALSLPAGQLSVAGPTTYAGAGTATVATTVFNHTGNSTLNSLLSVTDQATLAANTALNANGQLYLRTDQFPDANLVNNGILTGTVLGLVTNATAKSGGAGFMSTLSTNVSGSSMRYQWQSSTDNSQFSDIPGANAPTYTATVNGRLYYRSRLTTTNSGYDQFTPAVLLQSTQVFSASASASPNPVCTGSTATLTASSSNGTAPYTYTWTAPAGANLSATNTATVSTTPTTAGVQTFTVSVTDANNLTSAATVSVTANAAPTVAITPASQTITAGNSAMLTASGADSYVWSTGDRTAVITIMPAGTTPYSVTGTTGSCSATASATVTVAAITDRITVLSRDPDNGQLNTNTIKPYLQLQNDGNTPIPYAELTVRYYLTVDNPAPLVAQINYAQVGTSQVHARYVPLSPARQGASGYVEFSFDAPAGSLGAMSNSGDIQNSVRHNDYSSFNQGDDYSYVLNRDFAANPRITAYRNGVLIYGQEPGAVGPPTPLMLSASANPTILPTTGSTTLSASPSGGTSPYTYRFSGPGTIQPSGSMATVSNLPAGVQTFTVVVSDAASQTASATVSVTVTAPANTPPVASANSNQTATQGMPFTYTVNAFSDAETPDNLTYSASFNPANSLTFNPTTRVIQGTPMNTGVTSVTVTATDPGGLSSSTTFTITVNPSAPVATANPNQTATVGTAFTYTVNAFTGTAPITYAASNLPAGLSFDAGSRVISGTPTTPATSTVTITGTNSAGMSSTRFTITVNPAPVASPYRLTVLSRDPDNGQLNTNTIKPYLQLQNSGISAIPYGELTVRYYLTVEDPAPFRYEINYAQMGNDKVHLRYVPLSPARQGATGYIEFSFDASAGNLGAMSNAVIQDLVGKQDYSYFNQGDDYSYVNSGDFKANPRITAYMNGALVWGTEPPSGTRLGVEETESPLRVTVLGNPVSGSSADVLVEGAVGQRLSLQVIDLTGWVVTERQIERAGSREQLRLSLGHQPAAFFLLRVSSPTQSQTVKVMKLD